jgi:hypothetical protein
LWRSTGSSCKRYTFAKAYFIVPVTTLHGGTEFALNVFGSCGGCFEFNSTLQEMFAHADS